MRIECSSCNSITEAKLVQATAEAAVFACTICEAETKAPVEAEAPTERPAESRAGKRSEADDSRCPKCDARVGAESANCRSCGLDVQRFAEFDARAPQASPQFLAAWKLVDENWDTASAHEAFASAVERSGNYLMGARWYRRAMTSDGRSEKATEMLQRLQTMATANLLSSQKMGNTTQGRTKKLLLVVLAILICAAGIGILLTLQSVAKQRHSEKFSPTSQILGPV